MNGVDFPVSRVLDGIAAAREAGLAPIKINTVVRRGMNEASILPLARWARDEGLVLRFIEYMDVGHSNGWRLDDVVPAEEILATIDAELPLEPVLANYRGEVAGRYRFRDGGGELGVIASVSRPFCGDCTRARLSAEGHLYTCLFARRRGRTSRRRSGTGSRTPSSRPGSARSGGAASTATPSCAARRPSACPRWRCSPSAARPRGTRRPSVHRSSTAGENVVDAARPDRARFVENRLGDRPRGRNVVLARRGRWRPGAEAIASSPAPPGRLRSPQGHADVRSAITSRVDALRSLRVLQCQRSWPARVASLERPDGRDRHPGVGTPPGR